ncbi:hypothetical protein [Microbispora bryophytorum]|uniref:hypothetical protein n=1 Tax=Microbispora bryophytorum TaxID=1460882 RepID=UPI0033CAF40C
MRDVLVSTGNPDADAYLRIVRTILPMQVALDHATAAVENGRPEQSIPYGEPYPTYEHAALVVLRAPDAMDAAWEKAHSRYTIAKIKAPKAAELADSEAVALFEEYHAK